MYTKKRWLSLVICVVFVFSLFFLLTEETMAATELISLDKPVTASSTASGYDPMSLTDGADGLWASAWVCSGQQYCIIDLMGFYTIEQIDIVGAPGNTASRTLFRVTASLDATSGWREIVAKPTEPHPESGIKRYAVDSRDMYRYVKIERTDYTEHSDSSNAFVLGEVSVYGTAQDIEDLSTHAATVTASTTQNSGSEANLADGNASTYWESSYTSSMENQYFTFDLQDSCAVSHIAVTGMFGSGNVDSRRNFKILASNDASFASSIELVPQEMEDIGENVVKMYTIEAIASKQFVRYIRFSYTAPGYRAATEMTVYGKRAKLSLLACEYQSGAEICTELIGNTEVCLNAEVKNNTKTDATVSSLLVLSREGRVLDVDYRQQILSSKETAIIMPQLTLPSDVSDCVLRGYIFTDFASLRPVGMPPKALTALQKSEREEEVENNGNGLFFDYASKQLTVGLHADEAYAGRPYFALVFMPDAAGNAQEGDYTDDSASLKSKLLAVQSGILNESAAATFSLPIYESDNGGVYRVKASALSGEEVQLLGSLDGTYLNFAAQKQIVSEIQSATQTVLEDVLQSYCKGSLNEIMPEIDLSHETYQMYKDEVLEMFIRLRTDNIMTTVGDVSRNFRIALQLVSLKHDDVTEAALDRIIDVFELRKEPYFNENMRAAVVAFMNAAKAKNAFADSAAVGKAFDSAVFLQAVKAAVSSEVTELVEAYQNILRVSYGSYNALQINKVLAGVDFASIEEFETAFQDRKKEIDSRNHSGEKHPSVGGGGGGRISFEVRPTQSDVKNGNTSAKEAGSGFNDISHVAWAREGIMFLYERGVSGKENGCFAPDDFVKREEGAKMLLAALGVTAERGSEMYVDAKENEWYMPYVATVNRMGYLLGDDSGRIGVGQNFSREDFSVMLVRVLESYAIYLPPVEKVTFADCDAIAAYAQSAVKRLAACGVIKGMDDAMFCPKQNVTRAQAAKMMYEIIQIIQKGGAAI